MYIGGCKTSCALSFFKKGRDCAAEASLCPFLFYHNSNKIKMCLVFSKRQRPTRKVATKDIVIYKLALGRSGSLISIFRCAPIEFGVRNTSYLDHPSEADPDYQKSFLSPVDQKILPRRDECLFISIGLHAICGGKMLRKHLEEFIQLLDEDIVLLKGIIPAGAEYYVNKKTGLIVSNAMIYNKIIDHKKYLI